MGTILYIFWTGFDEYGILPPTFSERLIVDAPARMIVSSRSQHLIVDTNSRLAIAVDMNRLVIDVPATRTELGG